MDRLGPWSAAGGVIAGMAVAAAIALWPLASHSNWELAFAVSATVLVCVGSYWMIAALIPFWPFLSRDARRRNLDQAQEASNRFDYWMNNYIHYGDKSDARKLLDWLGADRGYTMVASDYRTFELVARELAKRGYNTIPAPSRAEFEAALEEAKNRRRLLELITGRLLSWKDRPVQMSNLCQPGAMTSTASD